MTTILVVQNSYNRTTVSYINSGLPDRGWSVRLMSSEAKRLNHPDFMEGFRPIILHCTDRRSLSPLLLFSCRKQKPQMVGSLSHMFTYPAENWLAILLVNVNTIAPLRRWAALNRASPWVSFVFHHTFSCDFGSELWVSRVQSDLTGLTWC